MRYIIGALIGAALWRIGGSGFKWARRYGLPVLIALNAYIRKHKAARLLLFPLLLASFSSGYGESHPYVHKLAVSISWIIPRLHFLGFSWLAVIIPPVWIFLFYLSNHKLYARYFKWHWIELVIGALIGMAYA